MNQAVKEQPPCWRQGGGGENGCLDRAVSVSPYIWPDDPNHDATVFYRTFC